MKNIILLIGFSISAQVLLAGGPWPQAKGDFYLKLSQWWVVFDQHYTDQGLLDPNITTGLHNTNFYAEYGLGSNLTAVVNAPIFSRNYSNNLVSNTTQDVLIAGEAINSVGDIDLAVKYSFATGKIPLSATLLFGLPTGKTNGGTQGNLQTGDGEFNQMISLDAGFGGGENVPWYVSASVGFNNRTNQFSDEIRGGLEAGLGLFNKRLWLNSRLQMVESLRNGATAETTTSTSIFANNSEYLSLGLEVNLNITDRVGVSASVAGALRGEIIAAAPSYSVGVFYTGK